MAVQRKGAEERYKGLAVMVVPFAVVCDRSKKKLGRETELLYHSRVGDIRLRRKRTYHLLS